MKPDGLMERLGQVCEAHSVDYAVSFESAAQRYGTERRVILLHDGLTRFRYEYLLGGDDNEPSPWFMLALQQHIPIPVLPHWAPVLWARAHELSLVRPADVSFGPAVVWQLAQFYDLEIALVNKLPEAGNPAAYPSEWVLLTRNAALLQTPALVNAVDRMAGYTTDNRLWTDDFSNLFEIIK